MLLVLFPFLYYGKALNKHIVLLFGFAVIQSIIIVYYMCYTLVHFVYFLLDQSINIKTFINQIQNKSIFVCVISLFNISILSNNVFTEHN